MSELLESMGYIIQARQSHEIYGVGATMNEAWAMAVDYAGPFFDEYGGEISDETAFLTKFAACGATAALMAQVKSDGGDIKWSAVRGVACTLAEWAEWAERGAAA